MIMIYLVSLVILCHCLSLSDDIGVVAAYNYSCALNCKFGHSVKIQNDLIIATNISRLSWYTTSIISGNVRLYI